MLWAFHDFVEVGIHELRCFSNGTDLFSMLYVLEPEPGVVCLEEDGKPEERVDLAFKCLPHYDPSSRWSSDSGEPFPFRYWKIRDYGYAYRSKLTTPSKASDFPLVLLFRSSSRLINLCRAKGCRALHLSNGGI